MTVMSITAVINAHGRGSERATGSSRMLDRSLLSPNREKVIDGSDCLLTISGCLDAFAYIRAFGAAMSGR